MNIQVNTDNHIKGSEELIRQVEGVVEGALSQFSDRITLVEVFLTDESGSEKSHGDHMRCVIEARPADHQPITASHEGTSLEQALDSAADTLERTLNRTFERLDDPKGRISYAGDQTS